MSTEKVKLEKPRVRKVQAEICAKGNGEEDTAHKSETKGATRGKGHCQTHCINKVEVSWVCGPQMRCNEWRDSEGKMSVR